MKRPQLITVVLALVAVIGLYAATQKQIFGPPKISQAKMNTPVSSELTTDSMLHHAKEHLTAEQVTRLNFLENSITRGDVKDQQLHIFHQMARFWADTAKSFAPYAWYTGEAARLENSEKSLTFAARLFLDRLTSEEDQSIKQWEAFQAKDLFERSLKLNPDNDSTKVGLGAVYLYGGLSSPMEGIGMIREVVAKDSNNVYAQMTLAQASLVSGQLEKGLDRLKTVVRLQSDNLEAIILIAEINERMGDKAEAIKWYGKSLPLIKAAALKTEVQARIAELNK